MTADPASPSLAPPASEAGSVPASRVKSAASTASQFGYPHGHLGHLTETQSEALGHFKEVLAERKLFTPGPPPSHDDQTLLRFLRARRWIVEDAYTQFKETEEWRAANNIDVLYRTIQLDAYEQSRRLYPQWTGRRDRRGIPLYVYEIKNLDSKSISQYERLGTSTSFSEAKTDGKTPAGLLRLFALYENLTRFNQPFCTQLTDREFPDVPITMSTNIVDISGVGLKQFWNLKAHMQAASTLATAHYPETLDRIFVIGAPVFFSTVWGWIKRWFDPMTVSKIFILGSHEVRPVLESFIEPRNIPKKYGGELDYEFGQLGNPDPAWEGVIAWENGHTSFPTGPLLWQDEEGGERVACVALGATDGGKRNERICTLPKTWIPEVAGKADEAHGDEVPATPAQATSENTTTAATAVSEATQTGDAEVDESTQTGEVSSDGTDALEKLKLGDDEKVGAVPQETTPTVVA